MVYLSNETNIESETVSSTIAMINFSFVSESFKQMNLKWDTLISKYQNLVEFSEIDIKSNVEVTWNFTNEEAVINVQDTIFAGALKISIVDDMCSEIWLWDCKDRRHYFQIF